MTYISATLIPDNLNAMTAQVRYAEPTEQRPGMFVVAIRIEPISIDFWQDRVSPAELAAHLHRLANEIEAAYFGADELRRLPGRCKIAEELLNDANDEAEFWT